MYKSVCTESVVKFDWDESKAAANLQKHGVAFELAAEVWADSRHLLVFDRIEGSDERRHASGLVRGIVILTVVHTQRSDDEAIRIISARKAAREERRRYDDDGTGN